MGDETGRALLICARMAIAEALGGGHKDFSAIIKMIDESWTPPSA